ncbi:xanthine dehydrogenase family protein molybdopterin-binding subunit [Coralloluteibacterium stylophorae]|uniref:Xanthine dehydrogenase family protein molybdopterin-binding subunit n=1 Tax=Coralloluteibacterium stylophorae TaxID=1776034 RepID=A0A8J8AX89_9GAMM|nr:xanthine dehydrogenase family protein molybdopterin-binding subunit [Coralloluteibacterium stylophorae]MBS7455588.1 xanthine dehydrogenase family protein molybdopterin-binding subunit [Coralloluteibacterium stylophorae]
MNARLREVTPGLAGDAQIGRALDRVDGPLKVAGRAPYAYEFAGSGETAYGYVVGATVARGRIRRIDTSAAERAPGVVLVLTHENAPELAPFGPRVAKSRLSRPRPYLQGTQVRHWGDPVAFVVAESFEQARAAAFLVRVEYEVEKADLDTRVEPHRDEGFEGGGLPDSEIGDLDAACAAAAHVVDVTYTTPYQHHNAMEPHATLAAWDGERLTLHVAHQMLAEGRTSVADTLRMSKEQVRIVARYIGGGFGGKLTTECDAILSAVAARRLGRPVKTALSRQQTFHNCTHRNESVQRLRLAADADGRLTGIGHTSWQQTAWFDDHIEPTVTCTRALYAAANRSTRLRLVRLDLPMSDSMRAPGEAIGMLTLECAMDELAEKLGMDPLELRRRNDTDVHPEKGKPFSSRHLVECLDEGARRFGWDQRPRTPASRREGRSLIGYGMASAIRPNMLMASSASVHLDAGGRLVARQAMTDIGTGTYTILTQIAADALGLDPAAVRIEMGDTDFPKASGSGGSVGAASAGNALHRACLDVRRQLLDLAAGDAHSALFGVDAGARSSARFAGGWIEAAGRREELVRLLARQAAAGVDGQGRIEPGDVSQDYDQQTFGAHFAEVAVDADTGEIRLRRMLGVFAAGRILNPKTARSQALGGLVWGIGSALTEETFVDARSGAYVNRDLAEYHIPVHADAPEVEAIFLEEHDDIVNALGAKGIGELGICGAGAAVANAVYNASGVRIREFPLTLDKVLAGWAAQGR